MWRRIAEFDLLVGIQQVDARSIYRSKSGIASCMHLDGVWGVSHLYLTDSIHCSSILCLLFRTGSQVQRESGYLRMVVLQDY